MSDAFRVTLKQHDIIVHSLCGSATPPREFRNHFAASADSPDYRTCEELVSAGLMVKGDSLGYGHLFHVTSAGQRAVRDSLAWATNDAMPAARKDGGQ